MKIQRLLLLGICAIASASAASASDVMDANSTADLLEQVAAAHVQNAAVEVDFTEERSSPMTRTPLRSSGTLSIHPDGRFRREVAGQSIMVNDGKNLWIYYPAFGEVEKYDITGAGPASDVVAVISGGLQLSGIEKQFTVKAERRGKEILLAMVPKVGRLRRMIRDMQIELDAEYRLQRLSWTGQRASTTSVTFSNERVIDADDPRFKFSPPANTRVVLPLGD
ncbi:MAG: LolA family protein [Chthoniobacterales bacterium]